MVVTKYAASEEFREHGSQFNKCLHILQNINFAFPWSDWDEGVFSKREFQRRCSDTETEMLLSCAVNSFFSIIMVIPIWFTGKYDGASNFYLDIWIYGSCPFLDYKIKQRHTLLSQTIGVKEAEIISYTQSHTLMVSVTVSMIALCSVFWNMQHICCTTDRCVNIGYLMFAITIKDPFYLNYFSVPSLVENNQRRDC